MMKQRTKEEIEELIRQPVGKVRELIARRIKIRCMNHECRRYWTLSADHALCPHCGSQESQQYITSQVMFEMMVGFLWEYNRTGVAEVDKWFGPFRWVGDCHVRKVDYNHSIKEGDIYV